MPLNIKGDSFAGRYKRVNGYSIDSTDVWSTLEEARIYACNTDIEPYVPYAGQVISVIENGAIYKLVKDESIPETDGKKHFKLAIIGSNNDNDDRYLRRDIAETVQQLMTFLEGINVKGMATIEEVTLLKNIVSQNFSAGSTGMGIYKDEAGNYHLDIDFVNIRKKLTADEIEVQKSYYVGGKQWITPGAGIVCTSVEDTGTAYRCRFKTTDAEGRTVRCMFQPDDLAICETFNLTKQSGGTLGNHYYWRLVEAVGADYIDLSKSDCGEGSEAPQAGDEIVHLGNISNTSRQGAICSDAITIGGPYIRVYKCINDYHLPQPNIDLNPEESIIKARLISEATGKDVDDMINDVQANLDLIKEQTDKEYTIWFFEYTPTLNNIPASDWTTDDLKALHEQDMFYNRASGLAYRFVKSGNVWKWEDITDQQTIKALENAAKAQDTADSKRRVFVSQPDDSDTYDVGDLWVNATYGSLYDNDSLVCKTAKPAGAAFSIAHWQPSSNATTAYIENLGDRIIAGVTEDTDGKIEALKKLAQDGIDSATEIANGAAESIRSAIADIEGLFGRLDSADDTIAQHTTAIQATKDSIALLAEGIHFDNSGNITNINTSGLVTMDYFNSLFSERVEFDENGHITNISTSGLVTTADFSEMFAERAEADGYVKKSYIATFITELPDGRFQSNAIVDADLIRFNGNIVANDTFEVDKAGNMTLNNITAKNLTLSGDIKGNNATLNNITLNNITANGTVNADNGTIGGFRISPSGLESTSGNDKMLLSASLIRFTGSYSSILVGADTFPSHLGGQFLSPISIDVNHTSGFLNGNIGLHISVQGAKAYDDSDSVYTGNHALYVTKGDICGLRFRARRVRTSQTLSVMDTVIYVIASSTITLTLPANPENGQFYLIRNFGSGSSFKVVVNSGQKIYVNKTSAKDSDYTDHAGMQIFIYDAVNRAWLNGWFNAA